MNATVKKVIGKLGLLLIAALGLALGVVVFGAAFQLLIAGGGPALAGMTAVALYLMLAWQIGYTVVRDVKDHR